MHYEGHEAGCEVIMAEGAVRRSGPRSTIFQRTGGMTFRRAVVGDITFRRTWHIHCGDQGSGYFVGQWEEMSYKSRGQNEQCVGRQSENKGGGGGGGQ